MNAEKYSERARRFVQVAQSAALRGGHQRFAAEQLLKSLVEDPEDLPARLIDQSGGDSRLALLSAVETLKKEPKITGVRGPLTIDEGLTRVFSAAEKFAEDAKETFVTVEFLLLAIAIEADPIVEKILKRAGVTWQNLIAAVESFRMAVAEATIHPSALQKYAVDLTQLGEVDPILGRDEEVRQLIAILTRQTNNNVVLVGDAGVGKEAIVIQLAQEILHNDVPPRLRQKRIISLDKNALRATASSKADLEQDLSAVLTAAAEHDSNVIIFENEIDVLLNELAGVSHLLRSALVKGQLQLIASMTPAGFRRTLQSNESLFTSFQRIDVDEISVEEAIGTLRLAKGRLELHHGIKIGDSAVVAAAKLSDRYVTSRFLPGKAFDILDEAAALCAMRVNGKPEELDIVERQMLQLRLEQEAVGRDANLEVAVRMKEVASEYDSLEERHSELTRLWTEEKKYRSEIVSIETELEGARRELATVQRAGDFLRAGELSYARIPAIEARLKGAEEALIKIGAGVTPDLIAHVVSRWTGEEKRDILANKDPTRVVTRPENQEPRGALSVYIGELVHEKHVGDRYENIHGSNLIVRSQVQDCCVKLAERHDESYSRALGEMSEVVARADNPAASAIFNEFAKELVSESGGDKRKLKNFWTSLVRLVPDIATVGAAVAKITGLFL